MKKLITTILFSAILTCSFAQGSGEMDFGIKLGGANYLGEIGGTTDEAKGFISDMRIGETNIAFGGFFRYGFNEYLSAKVGINYARISGADSLSDNPARKARNLSFRTDLIEFALLGEFNFMNVRMGSRRSSTNFRMFITAGVGYLLYYPHANIGNEWIALRPLATEGIENVYETGTLSFPLGIGGEFTFNRKMRFGMDIIYRFTGTDYLDDVSTDYAYIAELPFAESIALANRSAELSNFPDHPGYNFYDEGSPRGNPDNNDGYLTMQFSFSYVLNGGSGFYRSRYSSMIKRRRKRTKF